MAIVWTATSIDQATFCPRRFYLLNMASPRLKEPETGPKAVGTVIHRFVSSGFFNEDGIPRYKSAKSCTNAAVGRFSYYVNKKLEGKVVWDYKNEFFVCRALVKNIMLKCYDRYVKEGPPLFSELPINKLEINGRCFKGKIDELRKSENGPRMIDLKTGHREPRYMKQKYDPQFTLYSLAIACLCHQDKEFAELIDVSAEQARRFAGNPDFITKIINPQYYFMRENKMIDMPRGNIQYFDLCDTVDSLERTILSYVKGGAPKPPKRGKNCDYCLIAKRCDEITEIEHGKIDFETQQIQQGIQRDLLEVEPAPVRIGEFSVWVDIPWRQILERKNRKQIQATQKTLRYQLFPRQRKQKKVELPEQQIQENLI